MESKLDHTYQFLFATQRADHRNISHTPGNSGVKGCLKVQLILQQILYSLFYLVVEAVTVENMILAGKIFSYFQWEYILVGK